MRRILVRTGLVLLWIALVVGGVLAEAKWFAHPSLERGDVAAIEQHGLGHELCAASDRGGRVVGHSGGTLPAFGAMVRVNPQSGDGFVLVVSGASGGLNQLVHDRVWWQSGQVTTEAREQIVRDRLVPAAVAILIGAILIGAWPLIRRVTGARSRSESSRA